MIRTSKVLQALIVALVAAPCSAGAQTPAPAPGLTVAGAIQRAMEANPSIAAARLQRPIDVAGVAVASERPNPELVYEASKETPRQSFAASLPIELGGKRDRRIDLANATMAVGEAELAQLIVQVRNDVRRAYFEAVAAEARVQISQDVRDLAQRARDAANSRVTAGDVPQSDLTQADLALAIGDSDLAAARGEVVATRAELNALLGQPVETPFTFADTLAGGVLPTMQAAVAEATSVNADVQLIDRRIAEQQAKIGLARAMKIPDLAPGGAFTYDAEPEFKYGWRVNFGITLPVFTTHKAGVVVEEATLARLQREREATVAQLSGGIAAALARAGAAREQANSYQTTILPLAQESERQAQAAYAGGQIGLPVLVQSLQTARETRQRGLDAGLAYQRALSDLEKAIGAVAK